MKGSSTIESGSWERRDWFEELDKAMESLLARYRVIDLLGLWLSTFMLDSSRFLPARAEWIAFCVVSFFSLRQLMRISALVFVTVCFALCLTDCGLYFVLHQTARREVLSTIASLMAYGYLIGCIRGFDAVSAILWIMFVAVDLVAKDDPKTVLDRWTAVHCISFGLYLWTAEVVALVVEYRADKRASHNVVYGDIKLYRAPSDTYPAPNSHIDSDGDADSRVQEHSASARTGSGRPPRHPSDHSVRGLQRGRTKSNNQQSNSSSPSKHIASTSRTRMRHSSGSSQSSAQTSLSTVSSTPPVYPRQREPDKRITRPPPIPAEYSPTFASNHTSRNLADGVPTALNSRSNSYFTKADKAYPLWTIQTPESAYYFSNHYDIFNRFELCACEVGSDRAMFTWTIPQSLVVTLCSTSPHDRVQLNDDFPFNALEGDHPHTNSGSHRCANDECALWSVNSRDGSESDASMSSSKTEPVFSGERHIEHPGSTNSIPLVHFGTAVYSPLTFSAAALNIGDLGLLSQVASIGKSSTKKSGKNSTTNDAESASSATQGTTMISTNLNREDVTVIVNNRVWGDASVCMQDGTVLIKGLSPSTEYELILCIRCYRSVPLRFATVPDGNSPATANGFSPDNDETVDVSSPSDYAKLANARNNLNTTEDAALTARRRSDGDVGKSTEENAQLVLTSLQLERDQIQNELSAERESRKDGQATLKKLRRDLAKSIASLRGECEAVKKLAVKDRQQEIKNKQRMQLLSDQIAHSEEACIQLSAELSQTTAERVELESKVQGLEDEMRKLRDALVKQQKQQTKTAALQQKSENELEKELKSLHVLIEQKKSQLAGAVEAVTAAENGGALSMVEEEIRRGKARLMDIERQLREVLTHQELLLAQRSQDMESLQAAVHEARTQNAELSHSVREEKRFKEELMSQLERMKLQHVSPPPAPLHDGESLAYRSPERGEARLGPIFAPASSGMSGVAPGFSTPLSKFPIGTRWSDTDKNHFANGSDTRGPDQSSHGVHSLGFDLFDSAGLGLRSERRGSNAIVSPEMLPELLPKFSSVSPLCNSPTDASEPKSVSDGSEELVLYPKRKNSLGSAPSTPALHSFAQGTSSSNGSKLHNGWGHAHRHSVGTTAEFVSATSSPSVRSSWDELVAKNNGFDPTTIPTTSHPPVVSPLLSRLGLADRPSYPNTVPNLSFLIPTQLEDPADDSLLDSDDATQRLGDEILHSLGLNDDVSSRRAPTTRAVTAPGPSRSATAPVTTSAASSFAFSAGVFPPPAFMEMARVSSPPPLRGHQVLDGGMSTTPMLIASGRSSASQGVGLRTAGSAETLGGNGAGNGRDGKGRRRVGRNFSDGGVGRDGDKK
ncbi:hypothetical protein BJ742DRAFT_432395 [Cladochytrium replicatum]|nr:hypothetical protein BJ742DRAFT_432395 [Cladochytrium replicatum]